MKCEALSAKTTALNAHLGKLAGKLALALIRRMFTGSRCRTMPLSRYCYRHFIDQMVLSTRVVRHRTGSTIANGRLQSVARKQNSNGDIAQWSMGMR